MPEDILDRLMRIPRQIAVFVARVQFYVKQFYSHIRQHWKKYAALAIILFFILKKDVSINLQLTGPVMVESPAEAPTPTSGSVFPQGERPWSTAATRIPPDTEEAHPRNVSQLAGSEEEEESLLSSFLTSLWELVAGDEETETPSVEVTDIPEEKPLTAADRRRAEKIRKQKEYIRQYVKVAQQEMEEFGIPASITLAQGLLESNAGQSTLASKNNNHFGIKCFSRRCDKGHCSNFNDDHHKDFFRIYRSPEESYRDHSIFLQSKRYRGLFKLKTSDYKGWARGLKKAGYATDRTYAEKLIKLIEDLKLYRYDRR